MSDRVTRTAAANILRRAGVVNDPVLSEATDDDVEDAKEHIEDVTDAEDDEDYVEEEEVDEVPPPAARPLGRPKQSEVSPFDESISADLALEFSLTYGKPKAHMPLLWFASMNDFLEAHSPKFSNSTECGSKDELLHGQAIAKFPMDGVTDAKIKKVVKMMKAALGIVHGDGSQCRICLKVLVVGQTFTRMIGYVFKDQGLPHFQNVSKNVDQSEIEAGIAEHVTLKLNYMDSKIAVNKSNLFQRAHTFWGNQLEADADVSLTEVLAEMMNSKKYMLSSTLIMNSQGQMRPEATDSYWQIVKGHQATKWDMQHILYLPVTQHGYRGYPQPVDKTPVREKRAELGEYVSLLDDDEDMRTPYEKIKDLLRKRRRVVVDDDDDNGDDGGNGDDVAGEIDEEEEE